MTDTELMALAALVNAEVCDVTAANNDRERRGYAMAYDGFSTVASKTLEAELKLRGVLPQEEQKK